MKKIQPSKQIAITDLPKDVLESLQGSMNLAAQAKEKMLNAQEMYAAVQNAFSTHITSIIVMKGLPKRDYDVKIEKGVVILS